MMNAIRNKTKWFLFTLLFFSGFQLNAQEPVHRTRFSLEIDPATFVFNGYSAHLRVQPGNSEHFLFGAGIYAMDLPSVIVDFNEKNRDQNWNARIDRGYGLFTEYHFSEVNKGWFTGTQISIQDFKIDNDNLPGNATFSNILIMGYGGYTFQPFAIPLYFKLWGGAGYTDKISGSNTLSGKVYDISPLSMFATLHMGYTF